MTRRLSPDELQKLLGELLPAPDFAGVFVEEMDEQDVRLRFDFRPELMGPGEVFSGPALLGFAETAMFAALQAALGAGQVAIALSVNSSFLRRAQASDTVGLARIVRRGRSIAHAEAWLFSHAAVDPVLHATGTYSIQPR